VFDFGRFRINQGEIGLHGYLNIHETLIKAIPRASL
jgi:hypothetical protein